MDPNEVWRQIQNTQLFLDPPRARQSKRSDATRFVLMSDTHGKHNDVLLPTGDVLIHAGDFTKLGEKGTIENLNDYFARARQQFQEIFCIAGNHDILFHSKFYESDWTRFHKRKLNAEECQAALKDCTYLQDSSFTLKGGGIEIFGSPWSPEFYDWAFNLPRGDPIRAIWKRIPCSTDVLITHGPPLGRGDGTQYSGHVGCFDLLQEVQERIQPRLHVFGHIHEGAGVTFDGCTLFVNAANLNINYEATTECVVVDLPHDKTKSAMVVEPVCQLQNGQLSEWLASEGYLKLVQYIRVVDSNELPSGEKLIRKWVYDDLCDQLCLHRDAEARRELRRALSQIYVESFSY